MKPKQLLKKVKLFFLETRLKRLGRKAGAKLTSFHEIEFKIEKLKKKLEKEKKKLELEKKKQA